MKNAIFFSFLMYFFSLVAVAQDSSCMLQQKSIEYLSSIKQENISDDLKSILESVKSFDRHTPVVEVRNALYQLHKLELPRNEIGCAVLIRALVPTIFSLKKKITSLLEIIDLQQRYWQEQQTHPDRYFFHKNPVKWFSNIPQKVEVSKKLKLINIAQQQHYHALGSLIIHEDSFHVDDPLEKQYAWVLQALHIINLLCAGRSPDIIENSFESILTCLRNAMRMVSIHEKKIQTILSGTLPPNIFIQNWIKYSSVLIGGGAVVWKAHQKKDIIKKSINNAYNDGHSFVEKQLKEAHRAFFEKYDPKHEEALKQRLQEFVTLCRKDHPELFAQYGDLKKKKEKDQPAQSRGWFSWSMDEQPEEIDQDQPLIDNNEQKITQEIAKRIATLDSDFLEDIFTGLNKLLSEEGSNLKSSGWHQKAEILQSIIKIVTKEGVIGKMIWDWNKINTMKQYKILFGIGRIVLVGSLPVAGFMLGKKILNLMKTRPDFTHLRLSLVDVGHLLNMYSDVKPRGMVPEDFGKLVFLVHKLEQNQYLVPKEYRQRFLEDITRLQSPKLSTQKKLMVVDFMYKTYDFLAFAAPQI